MTEFFEAIAWERFVGRATYLLGNPLFEIEERDRRRVIASRVQDLLEAVELQAPLGTLVEALLPCLSPVGRAYTQTGVEHGDWFKGWCLSDESSLRRALLSFCDQGSGQVTDLVARIDRFLRVAEEASATRAVEHYPIAAFIIGSLLNAAASPKSLPVVRFEPFERLEQWLSYELETSGDMVARYKDHVVFAQRLQHELRIAGVAVRDMWDVEALIFLSLRQYQSWSKDPVTELRAVADGSAISAGSRKGAPRPYLAICSCLGYDTEYLLEWIEFHRLAGVDRFFLYNNGDRTAQQELLAPYVDDGTVVLHDWPTFPPAIPAVEHCLVQHRDDSRWIAFIDTDEFLFSPTGLPLREVLRDYEQWPGVGVNWAMFGPGGHRSKPSGLVIESYLVRLNVRTDSLIKSIVDPRRVAKLATLHHFAYREGCAVDENCYPIRGFMTTYVSSARLRLNHYYTKSQEEWGVKHARLRPDSGLSREGSKESLDFGQMLSHEAMCGTRDEAILVYVPALRSAVMAAERRSSARTT